MKRTLLSAVRAAAVLAAGALTSVSGGAAMAQDWGSDRHGPVRVERDLRGPEPRGPVVRERDVRWDVHRWYPGQRLERRYYSERTVIVRPAAHHLRPAPRGHHWVRVGHDALLVVAGSGVVVKVMPGVFR